MNANRYQLPGSLPLKGAGFWERLVDIGLVLFCLPCALSQVRARHSQWVLCTACRIFNHLYASTFGASAAYFARIDY
jgi:hypothetical protein